MQVAVVGCAHGELETVYETLALIEEQENVKVDLLLCCGDFQATRNMDDLKCTAQPERHRQIGSFYKYYSGEKEAPVLTIFIGGNHEASNFLQELPFGGWVAPKIYYLGYAGVVTYKGLRIGGVSGIFKENDYFRGHFESPPYNPGTLRSVYHYRQQDLFRLHQLGEPVDIIMSHDWPSEVYYFGNTAELIETKPHFDHQIRDNILGSPPLQELMKKVKPKYWFSAHLHCKFAAIIPHDDEDRSETKFLGLDKCLSGRQFLQILDIEVGDCDDNCTELQYDLEWLTILYTTKHLMTVEKAAAHMPKVGDANNRWDFQPTNEAMKSVRKKFGDNLQIPRTFEKTAAPYDPLNRYAILRRTRSVQFRNRQTIDLCNVLEIDDPLNVIAMSQVAASEKS